VNTPADLALTFPHPLSDYPNADHLGLLQVLADRIRIEPFNLFATVVFIIAIIHTFAAAPFSRRAHAVQHAADARADRDGRPRRPSVAAEVLHFLGEVEVVFGLWAVVLLVGMISYAGWHTALQYFNDTVNYTEPLFVIVVMALASTRPIIGFAERNARCDDSPRSAGRHRRRGGW
jgi:hypothetical protein